MFKHSRAGEAAALAVATSLSMFSLPAIADVADKTVPNRDLNGALVELKPPHFDGPVPFLLPRETLTDSHVLPYVAVGTIAGLALSYSALKGSMRLAERAGRSSGDVEALGIVGAFFVPIFTATIGAAAGWGVGEMAGYGRQPIGDKVSIVTQVSSIDKDFGGAASSYTTKHGGTRYGGPYVMQQILIPESSIPLVSVSTETGLVEGQRIEAHFYVTPDTREILGWNWTPGPRAAATPLQP